VTETSVAVEIISQLTKQNHAIKSPLDWLKKHYC
jgi:hypothetical protein